ncbi:MAG: 50S ribosomal protein L1 [Archaeoglobaceae archaeon]
MLVEKDRFVEAVTEAINGAKSRNFKESVEIAVNLRNLDLKKPENRIDTTIALPHGLGKPKNVALFAGRETAFKAQESEVLIISPDEIDDLAGDKRKMKTIAKNHHFFIAEAPLMPQIGKKLGPVLAPRGKIPQPIQPLSDPNPAIEKLRRSIKIRTKDRSTFHSPVGVKDMDPESLAENAMEILKVVEDKYDNAAQFLRSVYVKTTMGPAVKVV